MRKIKKRNERARRVLQNRVSILAISGVLLVLTIMLSVASISQIDKKKEQEALITELEQLKAEEEARAEELVEQDEYVGTDQYIEDVAKDKLGLVYPNEILFEAEP